MSRISTATDGFSNPVYSMEDAISTCENDEISGDLVHNPVYIDDDMLQRKTMLNRQILSLHTNNHYLLSNVIIMVIIIDDSALTNPLFQGDDISMENSFYDDEVDQK